MELWLSFIIGASERVAIERDRERATTVSSFVRVVAVIASPGALGGVPRHFAIAPFIRAASASGVPLLGRT